MTKSITQITQNNKQLSKSIKNFFIKFHISSTLKASNAYKKKGVPVIEIKEYLCLISTNVNLDENEIIRTLESRESNDTRSLGELFLHFSDEMADITWIQAFQMLLQMFRTILTDYTELSDEKITQLVDTFMDTLPVILKTKLRAA